MFEYLKSLKLLIFDNLKLFLINLIFFVILFFLYNIFLAKTFEFHLIFKNSLNIESSKKNLAFIQNKLFELKTGKYSYVKKIDLKNNIIKIHYSKILSDDEKNNLKKKILNILDNFKPELIKKENILSLSVNNLIRNLDQIGIFCSDYISFVKKINLEICKNDFQNLKNKLSNSNKNSNKNTNEFLIVDTKEMTYYDLQKNAYINSFLLGLIFSIFALKFLKTNHFYKLLKHLRLQI